MQQNQNTVIIITGPTASGKTFLSLQLAAHFNTSIISSDSRQCFKELDIGVAKPTAAELSATHHYFINSHSIQEEVNAQMFEQYALNAADEIFKQNNIAIMVGGTGLYIKAFCEGLDDIPFIDEVIRKNIIKQYELNGLLWLQNEVQQKDAAFWEIAEQQNPQRLMRALEVMMSTGKSIQSFRTNKKTERPFKIFKVGTDISKEQLFANINQRTDEMIAMGLVDEVKSLIPFKHLNALQTVGYSELFNYFDGKIYLRDAVEEIKIHTRQYAKRQLTWFKKDTEIVWVKPSRSAAIVMEILKKEINK